MTCEQGPELNEGKNTWLGGTVLRRGAAIIMFCKRPLGVLRSQIDKTGYSERQVERQGQVAHKQVMGSEQLGETEEEGRWMEE